MMKSPVVLFLVSLAAIAAFTAIGPAEKTLGVNARIVYLHGAWVWAALAAFLLAGAVGLAALLARREGLHRLSRALGRSGLFFWITYLPISMWAMQANWNGLFLAEPRWRLAAVFAIGGLLLQAGLTLVEDPAWASAGNLAYVVALMLALGTTENVMHPPAPILNSDARLIQVYFLGLMALLLLAVWQVTRFWMRLEGQEA